jgi:hypothetical protein
MGAHQLDVILGEDLADPAKIPYIGRSSFGRTTWPRRTRATD